MALLLAGLLYLGGAAMTGMQTVHTVLLTGYSPGVLLALIFITGPFILGIFTVRAGMRESSRITGVTMAVTGILGLLVWAGFLICPLLALAGSAVILARSARQPGPV